MKSVNETRVLAAAGKQDIRVTRDFDAGIDMVFRAFSEPELLVRWFLPADLKMRVLEMDCRTGGGFDHRHTHADGMTFGFRGVFHEVLPPTTIVKTSEFLGLPQKMPAVLEYTHFESLSDYKTRVTIHTICPSEDFRNGMVQNGMEPALKLAHEQLDALLKKSHG
jgi:uncharacterized protein YndB with AHSA1/START domain